MIYMTTILQQDGGQTCRDTKKKPCWGLMSLILPAGW